MAQGTFAIVASVGGITINQAITTTGDHPNPYQLPLPIAWAGTIASATVTLPDGHAIVSGTVDVYWVAGGSQQCRYGCSATVTVDACALTGGTGDTLPTSGTVSVGQVVQFATEIYSSGVQFIVVNASNLGHAVLEQSDSTSVLPLLLPQNQPWSWSSVSGVSNPLTQPVGLCQASNGDATSAAVLTILSMENV